MDTITLEFGLAEKVLGLSLAVLFFTDRSKCRSYLYYTGVVGAAVSYPLGLVSVFVLPYTALIAARALLTTYQFVLTVLATFPLRLAFPIAVKILPKYTLPESEVFNCDGASPETAAKRKQAIQKLSKSWEKKYPKNKEFSINLKKMVSDVRFTSARCYPAFNEVINDYLDPSMALDCTKGMDITDIDGNSYMDISGSYGVNVCGYEMYKEFMETGWKSAKKAGLFLGSLDQTVLDNIAMLREVSGQPEVSFHMSGTEAVMAAVRVARFNTKRDLVVTFGGAYHGWWDGMQPVVGNERIPEDVLCLKDMNPLSLKVLKARGMQIAAVLINPLQCFHLNQSPPSDPVLSSNTRKVGPTPGYKEWLHDLRKVCSEQGIALIFDEVYTGFRLHPRGAQGAYDVNADIVVYGKTLGGGLPIGVVCGPKNLMTRGDSKKAARVAYVIGTFAGHPYVMATMNAFLKWLKKPETVKLYDQMHANIEKFIAKTNKSLKDKEYPVELTNWFSVWSIMYTQPGRYHWMFQYYMKDAGINLSWVGTGRLLFSLDWKEKDFDRLHDRVITAAASMQEGGWWEPPVANVKKTLVLELVGGIVKNLVGGLQGVTDKKHT